MSKTCGFCGSFKYNHQYTLTGHTTLHYTTLNYTRLQLHQQQQQQQQQLLLLLLLLLLLQVLTKVVCEKRVCERWCVTKMYVKGWCVKVVCDKEEEAEDAEAGGTDLKTRAPHKVAGKKLINPRSWKLPRRRLTVHINMEVYSAYQSCHYWPGQACCGCEIWNIGQTLLLKVCKSRHWISLGTWETYSVRFDTPPELAVALTWAALLNSPGGSPWKCLPKWWV